MNIRTLPGAFVVVEVGPLAEEESDRLAVAVLVLLADDALDNLVALLKFAETFAVDLVLLEVLAGWLPLGVWRWVVVRLLDVPHLLYVVFHLLDAARSVSGQS